MSDVVKPKKKRVMTPQMLESLKLAREKALEVRARLKVSEVEQIKHAKNKLQKSAKETLSQRKVRITALAEAEILEEKNGKTEVSEDVPVPEEKLPSEPIVVKQKPIKKKVEIKQEEIEEPEPEPEDFINYPFVNVVPVGFIGSIGIGILSKFNIPQQQLTFIQRDFRHAINNNPNPDPINPVIVIKKLDVISNPI